VPAFCEAEYNVVANARLIGASTNPSVVNVPGDIGKPETADGIVSEGVE
jgi:hypothetical protein